MADIVVTRIDGSFLNEIHFRPADTNVAGMRGVEDLPWISEDIRAASRGLREH
jgi:hypothetical protein